MANKQEYNRLLDGWNIKDLWERVDRIGKKDTPMIITRRNAEVYNLGYDNTIWAETAKLGAHVQVDHQTTKDGLLMALQRI